MIVRGITKQWQINKNEFKVFEHLENEETVSLHIKEKTMETILLLLQDSKNIASIKFNDLIDVYKNVDYLQVESLMSVCAIRIAEIMNRLKSTHKLKKIINHLSQLIPSQ